MIERADCYLALEKECGVCVPRCPRGALVISSCERLPVSDPGGAGALQRLRSVHRDLPAAGDPGGAGGGGVTWRRVLRPQPGRAYSIRMVQAGWLMSCAGTSGRVMLTPPSTVRHFKEVLVPNNVADLTGPTSFTVNDCAPANAAESRRSLSPWP